MKSAPRAPLGSGRPTLMSSVSVVAILWLAACGPAAVPVVPSISPGSASDIGLTGRIHINTQTTDFSRSRAFYRMLGFTDGVSGFPKTNTHLMARSLGMYDLCSYEIDSIEVMVIPDSLGPTSIDLIQFAVPFNPAPPYATPTHLGMAFAALRTTDLAADVAHLTEQGVEFLSDPYGVPGNRFVFFRDPDGVLFKLVETAPPHGDPDRAMHINAMPYVGVNVRDFDRSLAFYRTLGYSEVSTLPNTGTLAEARAYGLDRPFEIRGADITLAAGDGHRLRLTEWVDPVGDDPPYPAPINHVGIHRMALAVDDLDHAVRELRAHGAEFLSVIAPCCSGTGRDRTGIINLVDPDGIFLELVGPIQRREPIAPPAWCAAGQDEAPANRLITRLRQDRPAIGTFSRNPDPGLDFTVIDAQYGAFDIEAIREVLATMRMGDRASDVTPIVRIPLASRDAPHIVVPPLLNLGVLGVMFPDVDTPEQAAAAVNAMRYEPADAVGGLDRRGAPHADVWPLNPSGQFFALIQIESLAGVERLDEILDVPGIGAIFLGPTDLAASMGADGPNAPEVEAVVQTVLAACLARNVPCGYPIVARTAGDAERETRRRVDQGFAVLAVMTTAR